MGINIQKQWRNQFIIATIVGMIAGMLLSRALLSIAMIAFVIVTCFHTYFFQQSKKFLTTPLLFCISFLFFIPFISGLWSSNIKEWQDVVRIKLPLLFFPIAFAGKWQLKDKEWNIIAAFFLAIVFAGCCWSLIQYLQDVQGINKSYLKAKSIPTPLQNDHVRFSLLTTIAIILSVFFLFNFRRKAIRVLSIFLILFFGIYLHILSARTGLLAFYIFLFLLSFYWMFKKRNPKQSIVIAVILIAMPVAAALLLPTFQNRISYIFYDFSFIKTATYLPGANDGNRLLSIKGGWEILKQFPLGVGAGDVNYTINQWYDANVEGMLTTDRFKPSNEWLMYGLFWGWLGVLIFFIAMIVPLTIKNIEHRFFWFSLNIIVAFSFIFDIGLEVQYGVFIYSFVGLWWYKWFSRSSKNEC